MANNTFIKLFQTNEGQNSVPPSAALNQSYEEGSIYEEAKIIVQNENQ